MKWYNFKGKLVDSSKIDHQHLSNMFWYNLIIINNPEVRDKMEEVIAERFNGQLLPYRPHVDFKKEIDYLIRSGFCVPTDFGCIIRYKGIDVGEIRDFYEGGFNTETPDEEINAEKITDDTYEPYKVLAAKLISMSKNFLPEDEVVKDILSRNHGFNFKWFSKEKFQKPYILGGYKISLLDLHLMTIIFTDDGKIHYKIKI